MPSHYGAAATAAPKRSHALEDHRVEPLRWPSHREWQKLSDWCNGPEGPCIKDLTNERTPLLKRLAHEVELLGENLLRRGDWEAFRNSWCAGFAIHNELCRRERAELQEIADRTGL